MSVFLPEVPGTTAGLCVGNGCPVIEPVGDCCPAIELSQSQASALPGHS